MKTSPIALMTLVAAVLPLPSQLQAGPGTLNASFDPGTALGTACCTTSVGVYSIGLQTNGMMVVGGYFEGFLENAARNFLARLETDGTLDTSFDAKLGAHNPGWVSTLVLQPDGKIVIGGAFTSINGVTCNRLARLNSNGDLDTTFNPSSGADSIVNVVVRQADGKLLVGGEFADVNGVTRVRLARLNADGSLDGTFNPGTGANNTVSVMALQTDGRVLVGGFFTTINGTNQNRIARLNTDGSLDPAFRPPSGIDDGTGATRRVLSLVVRPDGKLLVGGCFSSVNGQPCTGLVRLATDGTSDTSFNVTCLGGAPGFINALALQPDGKVIVGGNFLVSGGATYNGICRLNPDGSLDAQFNPGTGTGNPYTGIGVDSLAVQPDGKVVIGGEFTSFAGVSRYHLARLEGDLRLQAALSSNQLLLSWPAGYTNCVLEYATDLNPPYEWETNWNPAVISGDRFVVTNPADGGRGFFRLKR